MMSNFGDLQRICAIGNIKWTEHALKRIRERKITATRAIDAIVSGVVVTHYHDDKPFPSWLIYNDNHKSPLHVVASTDGACVYVITAYVPSVDEWEEDYTTRKGR